jgi:Domain of unknown function (DUF4249)
MKFINLILLIFLINSCDFTNYETIEIEPQKSQIVTFCEIYNDPNWDNQLVILSRTRNLNNTFKWDFGAGDTIFKSPDTIILNNCNILPDCINFDTVKGAKLQLWSNQKKIIDFKQIDPFFKNVYSKDSIKLKENEKYQLIISAPDFDTVTSEQQVPKTVKLINARFSRNSYQSPKNGTLNELVLQFDNDLSTENYYAVDVSLRKKTPNDVLYVKTNLIKIDANATTAGLLSSRNFNQKLYEWHIGIDLGIEADKPIPQDFINLKIKFRSTGKAFNEYSKNLEAANNAKDNLFGEPITPFSNMKGGFGVFIISGAPDTLTVSIR